MKFYRTAVSLLLMSLIAIALPMAAQTEAEFLGVFSESFTTFTATGFLSHPGELDSYTFDIAGGDSAIFIVAATEQDEDWIRVLLFDGQDEYIDSSEGDILETVLPAGTYRIRIDSATSSVQSYSVVVFNGVEIESNDGLVESNDLGEVADFVILHASLQPPGDADFFRFGIPDGGLVGGADALIIETSGPELGDTTLVLYKYQEASERYLPIAFDDDSGVEYWSRLLLRPQPGDLYTLRVEEAIFPLEGIDEYLVALEPVKLKIDEEPNDTSATAVTLASTASDADNWIADGLLDGDDTVDFYKLILETSALVQINTEPQSGLGNFDTLLTLHRPNGDSIAEDDDRGDSSWSRITLALEAGEYFIRVEAYGDTATLVPYRLNVIANSVKTMSETEPNDIDETAQPISWSEGESLLIEAAIGLGGDIDSFSFVLDEETTVIFETSPRPSSTTSYDTTLSIYDEDLWEVAYNDDADGSWSRLEETLPAGSYYVIIEGYYDDETFEYMLLITPEDNEM